MSVPALALPSLDVNSFLAYVEGREGKWELFDGVAVAMSPARARHGIVKMAAGNALSEAIRRAALGCQSLVDTLAVRIRADRAFVPDALVVCPPPAPDTVVIDNPVIVLEVLSPSTAPVDHGIKLEGYFSLPPVEHYLILDPDSRVLIHHARGEGGVILTRILRGGALRLEPPGLDLRVEDLFGPDEAGPTTV